MAVLDEQRPLAGGAHRRGLRTAFGLVALVALAAMVVVLIGVTPGGTSPSWSFGPFAGYVWRGHVASVQGSWTVPRILRGSPLGHAGTWIGAQAPGARRPFIQIGTNDDHFSATDSSYYAFWSDTPATSRHSSSSPSSRATISQRASHWCARAAWRRVRSATIPSRCGKRLSARSVGSIYTSPRPRMLPLRRSSPDSLDGRRRRLTHRWDRRARGSSRRFVETLERLRASGGRHRYEVWFTR
jgi:hypothetical protein